MTAHHSRHDQAAPTLAFRVGVTGARECALPIERFRPQVETVLRQVKTELEHLSARHDVQGAYEKNNGHNVVGTLTLLSPLAMGADRLVARSALDLGYRLHVPMPFPQSEYENDFRHTPGSIAEFRDLLARAGENVFALDGADDDTAARFHHRSRSYEAVGRFVVHNCDVLIALWDGRPPKGRGGTHDIVRHAMEIGVPVWWIDVTDPTQKPIWLNDVSEPRIDSNPREACAELTDYMKRLLVPPEAPHKHAHGLVDRLVHLFPVRQQEPHLDYLTTRPMRAHWWWKAHDIFLRWAAMLDRTSEREIAPGPAIARYWYQFQSQSSLISNAIASRYRSAYVWLFLSISLSIGFAAFGLAFRHDPRLGWLANAMVYFEAVSLGLIVLIVISNLLGDWHQRWIDTRLLSELCRKQQYLAVIGWSLPGRAITRLVEEQSDPRQRDRAAWVPWFFAALQRSAPLPRCTLNAASLREPLRMAIEDLAQGQKRYHLSRYRQLRRASRTLSWIGEILFAVVLGIVAWKVCAWAPYAGPAADIKNGWSGLLLIVLPTLVAALVGIRAYAELDMVAEQSRHMALIMSRAETSLRRLEPKLGEPLVSQDMGIILHAVTTNMLQDIDGWARMFRVKVIEAG